MIRSFHRWRRVSGALLVLASIVSWDSSRATAQRAPSIEYRRQFAKAVRNAADRVLPAVVNVETIAAAGGGELEQDAPVSGLVVDSSGLVLASEIILDRPSAGILIRLPDGKRLAAEPVARDHHRRLVLLKVKSDQALDAIELSAADFTVGRTAVAVGRYGREGVPLVSSGIFSATGRLDGTALQIDARVSPPFYGGPVIDLRGNVVGITIPAVAAGVAQQVTEWYDSGISFAVPSAAIAKSLVRLRAGEDVHRGVIGIVAATNDPYADGTKLSNIRDRSPAKEAGLLAGDEIEQVGGTDVRRHQEIRQVLGRFNAGDEVEIVVRRDGESQTFNVRLAESIPPLTPQTIGVRLAVRDDATVVEAVLPGSPADGKLVVDDVIKEIDIDTLRGRLLSNRDGASIALSLRRGDEDLEVELLPESVSDTSVPESIDGLFPATAETGAWVTKKVSVPDAENLAYYVAPPADATDAGSDFGLLVLVASPGAASPEKWLADWTTAAAATGVVVCGVNAADESRWKSDEVDVIANLTRAVIGRAKINRAAVAIASEGFLGGVDESAADAMALAVGLTQREVFAGLAISDQTRTPAIRTAENEVGKSLRIILPGGSGQDLPTWAAQLGGAGYPVQTTPTANRPTLLHWTRLLQVF